MPTQNEERRKQLLQQQAAQTIITNKGMKVDNTSYTLGTDEAHRVMTRFVTQVGAKAQALNSAPAPSASTTANVSAKRLPVTQEALDKASQRSVAVSAAANPVNTATAPDNAAAPKTQRSRDMRQAK